MTATDPSAGSGQGIALPRQDVSPFQFKLVSLDRRQKIVPPYLQHIPNDAAGSEPDENPTDRHQSLPSKP